MNRAPARAHSSTPVKSLGDYLNILKRRRALVIGVVFVVALITLILAVAWPPVYRSSATILIEQQEIPPDLVRSTVNTFADQRLQIINQRVMTRANLIDIIRKYDLYVEDRQTQPMEVVVDRMRNDIQMRTVSAEVLDPRVGRPMQATIAFTLSYVSASPQIAQRVTNELTTLYLNENLANRKQMASQTSNFLTEEANRLRDEINLLESKLAEFKEKNVENLPELNQFNIQLADRTDRELMDIEQNLRAVNERRIYLKSQLTQISPRGALFGDDGQRLLGPVDRLKSLRARYIGLSAIYSADHPDLVRMRKEIASLEAETGDVKNVSSAKELDTSLTAARGELAASRKRYGDQHPDVKRLENQVAALENAIAKQSSPKRTNILEEVADNPAYIQLQAQLQAADAEAAALERKKRDLRAKLENLERRVALSPGIEQKYRELTREYDNAWIKYKEMRAKQTDAQLAESLESERKGERFTLIEPPDMPEQPYKPNRIMILAVGFVLALGLGIGSALLAEGLNNTVRSESDISHVFEAPPLAAIPYIATAVDQRRYALIKAGTATGIALSFILIIVWFHTAIMPLDIAWFVALRRLGL